MNNLKRRNNNKVVFKEYNMSQLKLPIDLEVEIPDNHLVKIVNSTIEQMNIEPLIQQYKGGGTSAYHPKMMLKVLVYAYTQKIYSSRKIAKALRENIHFMWISGKSTPNFRTINIFRSSRMKNVIDEVFASVIQFLITEKLVKLEDYFLDGTKIEANANKYTFVWKKSVEKNKLKLDSKIKNLISEIDRINEEENQIYGEKDLEELGEDNPVSSDKIKELVEKINKKIAGNNKKEDNKKNTSKNNKNKKTKEISKIVKTFEKDLIPRLEKYEKQLKTLDGRNSYSKSDNDATFMRMKEDHMLNGQLKPGYNIQIGTENQFILNYSVHQEAGDTTTLQDNIEKFERLHKQLPQKTIADSGYGSEENYEYLKEKGIESFVKYNYFHKEQKRSFKKEIYRVENLKYDTNKDEYICPNNKRLKFKETQSKRSKRGYISNLRIYECEDCTNCPNKTECTKSFQNRKIKVNPRLNDLKQEIREKLLSPEGRYLRGRRCCEVESVFGQIKWNDGFKRFLLRGLDKVNIEWGLISIAHNMKKLALSW